MGSAREQDRGRALTRLLVVAWAALASYVVSSGPVLAAGFWLQDKTDCDYFYAVIWIYYPLLRLAHNTAAEAYFLWWTELFGTSFPG
jgi:hypothetical protein